MLLNLPTLFLPGLTALFGSEYGPTNVPGDDGSTTSVVRRKSKTSFAPFLIRANISPLTLATVELANLVT